LPAACCCWRSPGPDPGPSSLAPDFEQSKLHRCPRSVCRTGVD
jgi:hypothetical protein